MTAVATATARVVPDSSAQDISTLEVALEAQAGITSAVDPGLQNVVEVDVSASDAGTEAVWSVTDGDAASGNFQVAVDGAPTANIAFNADAAAVKAAIEALPMITTVTVTGVGSVADPFVITFDDPIADINLTFIDVDLGAPTGEGATETTPGVAPSATTAATAITDAIAAVTNCQQVLGSVPVKVADPVITSSDGDNALAISEAATAVVTYTTALTGAKKVSLVATDEAGAALDSTVFTFEDEANKSSVGHPSGVGSNVVQGRGRLLVHPPASSAGTYYVVVVATDENDRVNHNVLVVTVSA